jgi:hypothetical protein
MKRFFLVAGIVLVAGFLICVGCQKKKEDTFEKAGKKMDEKVKNTAKTMKDVGKNIKEEAKEAADETADTVDDAAKKLEESGD